MSETANKTSALKDHILYALSIATALTALIPIARAFHFVLSAGVNVPSNDDVVFFNLIERMTRSDYPWQNYFSDTLINGHSFAVGQALFWLNAVLTRSNQTAMICAALLLLLARLHLTNDYLFGKYPRQTQLLSLPILSVLLFAPSQTAILGHGTFSLTWQLNLFANIFSLWAITKWKDSPAAKAVAAVSITIGCWTGALSTPVLPLLFLQNYLNGARHAKEYLWIMAATTLSIAPYLASFTIPSNNSRSISQQIVGFNPTTFLNILGRPFSDGIGYNHGHIQQAYNAGLFGLICLGILLFMAGKNTDWKAKQEFLIPSIICMGMGTISVALVATVRPFIAPTNCSISALFWCSLAALAIYCFACCDRNKEITRVCALFMLASVVAFTVVHSRKFEDKQYYLDNRAPFCASMLRHYRQAPTYATSMMFKLDNTPPTSLAIPLESHGWSVFAPHREYILQGDFALPLVVLHRKNGGRIFWVKGESAKNYGSWKTYVHLNLALQGQSDLDWQVKIPKGCATALLDCKQMKKCGPEETVNQCVRLKFEDGSTASVNELETPQGINLCKFAGQTITIQFHHTKPGVCIFKYPTLELDAPCEPPQIGSPYEPGNILNEPAVMPASKNSLQKIDAQRISVRPAQPITVQEFQSLDFLTTGKPGLVNCVVKYKNGNLMTIEIPIFGPAKAAIYSQAARIFDDQPDQIEELSIVNKGPGVLADYVVSGWLKN